MFFDSWGIQEALIGCCGGVVFFDDPGFDSDFGYQLSVWAEVVLVEAPEVIQGIEAWDLVWVVDAIILQELPDMGPVFLFDMGVVVAPVGSGTGKFDGIRVVQKIMSEVVIEELGAVIDMKAQDGKREFGLHIFDLLQNPLCTFVPDGPILRPTGTNVRESDTPDEIAGQRIAAMCDRIGLQKAWLRGVPLMSDRNLGFKQRSWFGATEAFLSVFRANRLQNAINGRGTDPE